MPDSLPFIVQNCLNPNLLIISEKDRNLAIMRMILGHFATQVIEAQSGEEALSILPEHKLFLIIVDVDMGEMDGYATAMRIRANPAYQEVPIIFLLAANQRFHHDEKSYETGFVDYMNFPIDSQALAWKTKVFYELYQKQQNVFEVVTQLEEEVHTRKRAEAARESTIAKLELEIAKHRQTQAMRETLEQQLRQAQKMKTIGTLAGGIAHDFNNILGTILGFTDLMVHTTSKEDPNFSRLANVKKAAERASSLVSQILTFSRQREHVLKPVHLYSVLEESIELLSSTIPSSIEIEAEIDRTSGAVLADSTQIEQVVINLCKNAADALANEEGRIEVSLQSALLEDIPEFVDLLNLDAKQYVRLTIKDNGCGMSQDTIERVFEPFFTTKSVDKGTGLGLSVVHGIVKEHKGEIHIDSKCGQGTMVSVFFPETDFGAVTDTHEPEQLFLGSGSVLLVDDDRDLAETVETMLKRLGYEVVVCTNSLEALKAVSSKQHSFDLIITDQVMPNMTGTELIESIRLELPTIPVVMISGFNNKVDADNYMEFGIQEYVTKPFDLSELSKILQKVLIEANPEGLSIR